MKYFRWLPLFWLVLTGTAALDAASAFDDKTPAYFADRYGLAKSVRTVSKTDQADTLPVKGPFSIRVYKKENFTVQAIFFLPSLRLAFVQYSLQGQWTDEQVDAALNAFGREWKRTSKDSTVRRWSAPDGSLARCFSTQLTIQSKEILEAADKAAQDREAKRKAVPKF